MDPSDKPAPPSAATGFFERIFGLAIFALLLWGSFLITRPFVAAIVWAVMIAVSIWPLHRRLSRALRGRAKLSAILLSLVLAAVLIVPVAGLLASLADTAKMLVAKAESGAAFELPPPPAFLARVPLVGGKLQQSWADAVSNVEGTYARLRPSIEAALKWLLASTLDLGLALLQFLLAIGITAPMLIGGPKGGAMLSNLAARLAPERGAALVDLAARCIRSVSFGVIGTALVQGALMAIGLAIAGVPGVVVLGFASFLLAVLQIGVFPVWLLAAAWLADSDQTGWAVFTVVWGIAAGLVDNFMKPYLISHGTGLPLALIFLGVLGGMIAWGFVGIFVGPTVLAVTYTLMQTWMSPPAQERGA
jgi:predicted PurR-regulated permease PerM